MKIKCNDLEYYVIHMAKMRIKELITKTYKNHFDDFKGNISIRTERCSVKIFNDNFSMMKGHITRKYIKNVFENFEKLNCSMFAATYNGCFKDDHIVISDLSIVIYTDYIDRVLLININSFDAVMRMIDISIRHEVGHLLDFMSFNGITEEEYDKENQCDTEETEKFNEFLLSLDDESDPEVFYRMYYDTIDRERRANENVGLTWKDFYEIDKELRNDDDCIIEITKTKDDDNGNKGTD